MTDPAAPTFYFSLLAMIATTALWAVAFIVPIVLPEASAMDITFGRYFAYGLCSAVLLLRSGGAQLRLQDWYLAAAFSVCGNVLYYFLLVVGIQYAGASLAVPIVGLLPVTVALAGNIKQRSVPLRSLIVSLVFVFVGVMMINVSQSTSLPSSGRAHVFGIICLVLPVMMWTWYAVENAAYLKRRREMSSDRWSSAIGVATLAITLATFPLYLMFGGGAASIEGLCATGEIYALTFWSAVLGIGASWGGAALFNVASKNLPVSVAGQLIVFETFFGASYVFLADRRQPSTTEVFGFLLCIAGIWLSTRMLDKHRRTVGAAAPDAT